MKKTIIFIFISMLVSLSLKAQIYNRYNLYFTDLYSLNSAAVSTDTMMSATLFTNFANVGFSGSPATVTMMAKGPVDEISGIGLRAFHDSRGAFRTNSFLASYAYKLRFAETGHHLAMGLSAGVYMQNFRIDQIDAIQMDEQGLPVVDIDKCTACGDCVEACPKSLFSLEPLQNHLWVACKNLEQGNEILEDCEVACTACGRCAMDAPGGLIEMAYNLPVIHHGAAAESKDAIQRCPTGAIVWWNADGEAEKGKDAKKIIRKGAREVGAS